MSERLPARRLLAEGAVIVVSVLVALSADAAWAERQERQREDRYLRALTEEMLLARDEIRDELRFPRSFRSWWPPEASRLSSRRRSGWP